MAIDRGEFFFFLLKRFSLGFVRSNGKNLLQRKLLPPIFFRWTVQSEVGRVQIGGQRPS